MRGKKSRPRPAAFAVEATSDSPVHGLPAWPATTQPRPETGRPETGRRPEPGPPPARGRHPEAGRRQQAKRQQANWPPEAGWRPGAGPLPETRRQEPDPGLGTETDTGWRPGDALWLEGAWPEEALWLDGEAWPPDGQGPERPWPPGERQWPPEPQWPDARAWPESGQRHKNGHRQHHRGPADGAAGPDPALRRRTDQIPQVTWFQNQKSIRPQSNECPIDSQIAGASADVNAASDAEWSPKGVRVRRNSLLRRRRRAGGGAMVRKATLDRSLRPDGIAPAEEAVHGATEPDELTGRRPAQRRGAGGRWMVWAFRAVIWAVLLIIGFRGVMAIVGGDRPSGSGSAPAAGSSGFPVGLAEAFALQFGNVYLNFSPRTAARRANNLVPFIPVGADPQFGWNGSGSQQLQSEQVASISVQDAHHAVVRLLAQVSTGLIELGVPVYAAQGGLVVSAEPALLPGPVRASPPAPSSPPTDSAAVNALNNQLPEFFRAYASGDQQTLGRFLAPGASVTGLGGAVTFASIAGMEVPTGGPTRRIAVSVVWQLPGQSASGTKIKSSSVNDAPAGLEMTYEMTVVKQNGSWYVQAIGPSAQQPGGP